MKCLTQSKSETESRMVVGGKGNGEEFSGRKVSVMQDEKVLEIVNHTVLYT